MRSLGSLLFGVILIASVSWSSLGQQRNNYGMLLEPVDGIMHTGGQDDAGFDGYWNSMQDGEKPIGYMFYLSLRSIQPGWGRELKEDLLQYKDQMIILQIGLELTAGGFPFTDEVNSGTLDPQIETFIDGLHEIGL
ncbi:MAG: hypothetical protein HKN13_05820, partial [Rhodothermales bacterium]|nr:hypothetical protein [Rhodothermales bacterium]